MKPFLRRGGGVVLLSGWIFSALAMPSCRGRGGVPRDADFQAVVSEKMASSGRSAAVVLDLRDGRILAMTGGDLACGSAFPIGSLMKLVVAAAAKGEGIASADEPFLCEGKAVVAGEQVICWLPAGHGKLDMPAALAVSCNLYFYSLAGRLSWETFARYAASFGLGRPTGADVAGENEGRISRTVSARDFLKASIGRTPDVLATPLQAAVMAGVIATDGYLVVPRRTGEKSRWTRTNMGGALEVLRDGMRRSVLSGTASLLRGLPVSAAAKTGTARWEKGFKTHGWIIGFAPFEDPEIAFSVLVVDGQGRKEAAAAAVEILMVYSEKFKKTSDNP